MIEAEENILQEVVTFLSAKVKESVKEVVLDTRSSNILAFSGLEIRLKEQTVYRNNIRIFLTHREFFILVYLARHPGWVLSKEQIYEAVWKEPGDGSGATVTNMICQLRRKIGDRYIETVVGSG